MATRTTPTTLGNLEFTQIKKSLTDYLRDQSILAGYNFEGSVMQTVIDMLAYNTFYYAYYANMINAEAFLDSAQKEDSIISLCKPLGFTVPSRTAAVAKVFVGGLSSSTVIPAGTRFFSSNADGVQYSFYNLENIPLVDGNSPTEGFDIYEATRYVQFDALPNFDFINQRIAVAADGFDLDSIQVIITERINEATVQTEEWTRVQNVGYTARVDENIYFVERTSSGFAILFGNSNSLGKSIGSSIERIQLRYILTSGSDANNLSFFTVSSVNNQTGVVQSIAASKNGKTSLDLDEVRFVAPKWFAAQERAVTVNDYKALLLQSGYFTSQSQFNVFGGQDLVPPRYGRVFVSSNLLPTDPLVTEMIEFLKERSVVTILPEYVLTESLNLYTDFTFGLGPGTENTSESRSNILAKVKSLFRQNYTVSGQYNLSFSSSDFVDLIRASSETNINTLVISPDNFTIYLRDTIQNNIEYTFNLGNELAIQASGEPVDITEPFNCAVSGFPAGNKGILKMAITSNSDKNQTINLQLWARNETTGNQILFPGSNYGYFISNKGVINIKKGVIADTAVLDITFAKKFITIGLNNLVSFDYNTVTIL